MTEEQKAERKTLIANNRTMKSVHQGQARIRQNPTGPQNPPKGWQYFTIQKRQSGYDGKVATEMTGTKTEDKNQWGCLSSGPM